MADPEAWGCLRVPYVLARQREDVATLYVRLSVQQWRRDDERNNYLIFPDRYEGRRRTARGRDSRVLEVRT